MQRSVKLFRLRQNALFQYQKFGFFGGGNRSQPPDYDVRKDYYKILGVAQNADEKDIKTQYYKLAQQHHPDKNQGKTTEKFKEITDAYNILGNQNKKKEYDEVRKYSNPGPGSGY